MRFRYIGTHADQLENGRPVAPGDFVELEEEDLEQPQNKMLLEDGWLLEVGPEAEIPATDAAEKLARKENIELSAVTGTGLDGQITVGDIERTIQEREDTA